MRIFTIALIAAAIQVHAIGQDICSGVPWFDTNKNLMNSHGCGIIQIGTTFFMIGEKRDDNPFPIMGDLETHFTGVSLYSSQDLVNWKYLGDPVKPIPGTEISSDSVAERPNILYNKENKEYIIYLHTWSESGNVGYLTSPAIEGPYTYRGVIMDEEGQPVKGGDIGVYQDEDNSAYLLETNGLIYKFSSDYKKVEKKLVAVLPGLGGLEAPAMFKAGGVYFFIASRMTWWHNNDNYYATASSIDGEWTTQSSFAPKGSMTWNSQTTFVLPVNGSQGTTFVYMGDRWCDSQWSSGTVVWQPLTVEGKQLSMETYHPAWKLDVETGKWSDLGDGGTSIDDSAEQFHYKGDWTFAHNSDDKACFNGTQHYSQTKDDEVTLDFQGTQVRVFSIVDHRHGIMGFSIEQNGKTVIPEVTVDLYTDASRQANYLAYSSPTLPSGSYTLKCRITGLKNHYSGGTYGVIDRAVVR